MVVKRQDRNRQAQEETHTHADIAGIASLGKKTQQQPKNCRNNENLNVFHNLTSFLPPFRLVSKFIVPSYLNGQMPCQHGIPA